MHALIDAALQRSRTVLMLFTLLMVVGVTVLIGIPKESSPDVAVPIVYVSVAHDGIAPRDADALIYKPLERELRGLDGLKEMVSTASTGHMSVMLEFYSDVDIDKAIQEVRQKVDDAKADLPEDSHEPRVVEVNVALFPIAVVTLSGDISERELYAVASDLQDRLEALPGVLEATIQGKREDIAEIVVDPARLDNYQLSMTDMGNLVRANSTLVASEDLQGEAGRFGIRIPGRVETIDDILNMPIKVSGDEVVLFRDVAAGHLGYKDRSTSARINGKPAVTLEIKKRIGANIIETMDQVGATIKTVEPYWPNGIRAEVIQDSSREINSMLNDLFNNVLVATLMVIVLVLGSLGIRNSLLIGTAIPGAFLMGVILLALGGSTMNMVVLFALILSIGMLVDGAIVVTEYADRRLAEGHTPRQAYGEAARRMAWPITSSTATTLAVFLPLLFWPGTTGEFMKYLPLTLLYTLSASLVMALIVVPVLGSVVTRKTGGYQDLVQQRLKAAEEGNFAAIGGLTGFYVQVLQIALRHPLKVLTLALGSLVLSAVLYGQHGHGVEFFPDVDSDTGLIDIRARGNLSISEREALVLKVERSLADMSEIESVYTAVFTRPPQDSAPDLVGRIQIGLIDWEQRRSANQILKEIEQRNANLPGIIIETNKKEGGPPSGADIQLQLTAMNGDAIIPMLEKVRAMMEADPDFKDIRDDRPLEGVEWQLQVDREEASRYGTSIAAAGSMIRMLTGGQKVGAFQPDFSDDEVDIVLRYPESYRTLDQLANFNITTPHGLVPASQFINQKAIAAEGDLVRINGKRRYRLMANVHEGVNATEKIQQLSEKMKALDWAGAGVEPRFRGDFEQMAETGLFLGQAFFIAIFLMATILVTQFNSFYQAGLIMSAIVLSVMGVLIGLLVRGEPFGIVMSGVGVIALAGIVVNNNIVLIDTYNQLRKEGLEAVEAALRTGAQRLRPVMLTAVTTVLGLIPMVMQWNIDLINRHISSGAPSSQWWTQLSTAIAGGLTFATLLTLILTPCLLVLFDQKRNKSIKT
ncbi:efflux RND transporter permease subunit [Parathalassolituus penaei]|uniref:Efflux RND transporter permease subunit n=1 Tax=Parathalassolituus penaei TaxID=2997323 RepID=A0A9X3EF84_9GAMM|nr:efflux RND transporter permease subunit [Parathalassolituus penaei]MCY0966482.1 efflux RND transporter permease subunit [Parathalassolituus penaei]